MIKKITHAAANKIRKITPSWVFEAQHYLEARLGQLIYRNPTKKMVVVGVVGSKGKTTLANMLWQIMNTEPEGSSGKAGLIGTADLKFGDESIPNHFHKTMPGRWYLQGLLRKMKDAKCKYVILEVPSEGQAHWRHIGVAFDILLWTNTTDEILASHKRSLDLLHKHNKRVYRSLEKMRSKKINGTEITRAIIANKDSDGYEDYLDFDIKQKLTYSTVDSGADIFAQEIVLAKDERDISSIEFRVDGQEFKIPIAGKVNISNAAGAIAVAKLLGLSLEAIAERLSKFETIGGRMEFIKAGQDYTVFVDYAHEELGIKLLTEWIKEALPDGSKSIILIGGEGGGRDEKKRPIMGKTSAENCDVVIVCDVDPYDDDPQKIIDDIVAGAKEVRPSLKDVYSIPDRREAISKALGMAKKGDIVAITGKGSEQSMIIGSKKIDWDDRKVVLEELGRLGIKE